MTHWATDQKNTKEDPAKREKWGGPRERETHVPRGSPALRPGLYLVAEHSKRGQCS